MGLKVRFGCCEMVSTTKTYLSRNSWHYLETQDRILFLWSYKIAGERNIGRRFEPLGLCWQTVRFEVGCYKPLSQPPDRGRAKGLENVWPHQNVWQWSGNACRLTALLLFVLYHCVGMASIGDGGFGGNNAGS